MALYWVMFKKKVKCSCGKKIDASYAFCPHCGSNLKEKQDRDKQVESMVKEMEEALSMPFFLKLPFEKLVKQMTGEIEKQFSEFDKNLSNSEDEKNPNPNITQSGISINISSSPEGEPVIQVKQLGNNVPLAGLKEEKTKDIELPKRNISEREAKRIAKLPRHEPETKVRRLTDKIVYEIMLPGIKDEKEISISKLENSIEIKAFAKDRAYFKLIPLALPIKKYYLENGRLILELKP